MADGGGGAVFDEGDDDARGVVAEAAFVGVPEADVAGDHAGLGFVDVGVFADDFGEFAEFDGDISLAFAVADDGHGDGVAGLVFVQDALEVAGHEFGDGGVGEGLAVDGEDDVAGEEAGFVGGFAGDDRADDDAGAFFDVVEFADGVFESAEAADAGPGARGVEGFLGDVGEGFFDFVDEEERGAGLEFVDQFDA